MVLPSSDPLFFDFCFSHSFRIREREGTTVPLKTLISSFHRTIFWGDLGPTFSGRAARGLPNVIRFFEYKDEFWIGRGSALFF